MSGHPQKMGSGGTGSLRPSPALFLSRLHNNPCAQDALPQFRAVPFYIVERRRSSYEFTFRPVGIADPCVFDKPLMLHPAVWTVGAAEKYRGAAEEPGFDVSARGDCPSCLRATNHKHAHKANSCC